METIIQLGICFNIKIKTKQMLKKFCKNREL